MNYGYIKTPGAVDLSNTRGISFGAASPDSPAFIDIDYVQNGCPAIAASDAENVSVQNVVIDSSRLPFTDATVVTISTDRKTVQLKLNEPSRGEWNTTKYPFLRDMYTSIDAPNDLVGFSGPGRWDSATGIATLEYATPRATTLLLGRIHMKHFTNMQAWGVYGFRVTGSMTVRHTKLLSCAGMGFRCDFCEGDFLLESSSLEPGPGRIMSSTADGVHLMHHKGTISLRETLVNGTGDDCFNPHANFIVLSEISDDRRSATYIDETGPGWVPQAPLYLVNDRVRFYSRLTLQPVVDAGAGTGTSASAGAEHRLVNATGGYGANATLRFDRPIPASVRRYDMLLSVERTPSLDVDGCTFAHGGRGVVMSVVGGRIANSLFVNGGRDDWGPGSGGRPALRNTNSILALNGGCGAFEDYTEGPFSRDILIVNNTFEHIAPAAGGHKLAPTAIIQFAGCRPLGSCAAPPALGPPQPYPMPPCEPGGSTQPPLQTHTGDDGPGRIVEGGQRLAPRGGSMTVFSNVTVRGNRFTMGAGSAAAFVDVGVTDGIVVTGNRMVRMGAVGGAAGGRGAVAGVAAGAAGVVVARAEGVTALLTDVDVYSSRGFDAAAAEKGNACFSGDQQAPCVVSVSNTN
jgi:hypothetical protein